MSTVAYKMNISSPSSSEARSDRFNGGSTLGCVVMEIYYHFTLFIREHIISRIIKPNRYGKRCRDRIDLELSGTIPVDVELYLEACYSKVRQDVNSDPPWLDMNKVKMGQQFAKSNLAVLQFCNMLGMYLLFAHERSSRPLIYSRKSSVVKSAFKRWISTAKHISNWYENDLTDLNSLAMKSIETVNKYHFVYSDKLNSMSEEEFMRDTSLMNQKLETGNNFRYSVRQVMEDNGVNTDPAILERMDAGFHLNQSQMALTQFGFIVLVLLYPDKYGIRSTQEEIESFLHLWKYLGRLLGIEDRYNICKGNVEDVKIRCRTILDFILKPCLRQAGEYWEHMSVCICEGSNRGFKILHFEATLALLLDSLDLDIKNFLKSMTFRGKIIYYLMKYAFYYVLPLNFVKARFNLLTKYVLDYVTKK